MNFIKNGAYYINLFFIYSILGFLFESFLMMAVGNHFFIVEFYMDLGLLYMV